MKREGALKLAFTETLAERLPTYLVLLQATAGAADRAIVGAGKTSWWEFKHATPDFELPGNQALMCNRLAHQGFCRFVIWWESARGLGKRTMIVHPRTLLHQYGSVRILDDVFTIETSCIGFDHVWLCDYIRKVHEGR